MRVASVVKRIHLRPTEIYINGRLTLLYIQMPVNLVWEIQMDFLR